MKGGFPSDADNVNENTVAKTILAKNEDLLKKIVFTKDTSEDNEGLLNEDQIKDLGK